jgi:hypothetical protein
MVLRAPLLITLCCAAGITHSYNHLLKGPADAFPVNAETRRMIEQAILAEYEKVVAPSEPVLSEKK